MTSDGGNWLEAFSESAWETVSEHRAYIGVFGTFFWGPVFALREGHEGIRLLPYVALAAVFFLALLIVSLAIGRPTDKLIKRLIGNNESTPVMISLFGLTVGWIFLFVWLFWLTYEHFLYEVTTHSSIVGLDR